MGRESAPAPRTWEEYAQQLGANLSRLRHDRSLTQEQLAHLAGTTRNHYQLLERGYWQHGRASNPKLGVILRLAVALQVDLVDVLPPHHAVAW